MGDTNKHQNIPDAGEVERLQGWVDGLQQTTLQWSEENMRLRAELSEARAKTKAAVREVGLLRQRLFGNRQVDSCNHSTACSIWGDDGQGYAEGFDALPPCNCGALINFERNERKQAASALKQANTEIGMLNHELAELRLAIATAGDMCGLVNVDDGRDLTLTEQVQVVRGLARMG